MRWKRYNFPENGEINSDSSEDESQPSHETGTVETEQYGRRQRQPNERMAKGRKKSKV